MQDIAVSDVNNKLFLAVCLFWLFSVPAGVSNVSGSRYYNIKKYSIE